MEKEKNEGRTECEIWQRVVGWMSPRSNMNPGKIAEVVDRKMYNIDNLKTNE